MSFNINTSVSKPSGVGFNFGVPAAASTAATATGFALPAGITSSSQASLGATSTSTATGLGLGQTQQPTASVAPGIMSFPAASSVAAASLTSTSTAVSTQATSIAAVAGLPQSTLATSTIVTSAPAGGSTSMNFVQLEENINRWSIELQDQEKMFLNQIQELNEWDALLHANSERLTKLHESVEQVKLQQQQLDHELDFIVAQQKDLEESLRPLEKELSNTTVTDPERENTYQLAENINSQLRQMSEDLKEVIEHVNETNRAQDVNDPMVQIGRILNAHMNSLQWIDNSCAVVSSKLDEVNKLFDAHRRELDRQTSYDG